jgi:hypothetical protein
MHFSKHIPVVERHTSVYTHLQSLYDIFVCKIEVSQQKTDCEQSSSEKWTEFNQPRKCWVSFIIPSVIP